MHGISTLEVEVTNISSNGFWIFIQDHEYFLPFKNYPWFVKSAIEDITTVKLLNHKHLYWERLDIDIDVECLIHPENYPLISKI
jgi:hypothetical protein